MPISWVGTDGKDKELSDPHRCSKTIENGQQEVKYWTSGYTTYCFLCGVTPLKGDTRNYRDDGDPNCGKERVARRWDDWFIDTVQVLKERDGKATLFGQADWGGVWHCKGGDDGNYNWTGVGLHSACFLILVSRVWAEYPKCNDGQFNKIMKVLAEWLFEHWDQMTFRGKIGGLDYGITTPRMNQDWDLVTGEEWLLCNPILLPPLQVMNVQERTNFPAGLAYFDHVQMTLLTSMVSVCQPFYRRAGALKNPMHLDPFTSPTTPYFLHSKRSIDWSPFIFTPDDIILVIFSYLDSRSLARLEQVHPRFANLIHSQPANFLWRQFCIQENLLVLYPDGITRTLHTTYIPKNLLCNWRQFYVDCQKSPHVRNLKRIQSMVDRLFSICMTDVDRGLRNLNENESDSESAEFDETESEKPESDKEELWKEWLNDAFKSKDRCLADLYVHDVHSLDDASEIKAQMLKLIVELTCENGWDDILDTFHHMGLLDGHDPERLYMIASSHGQSETLHALLNIFKFQGDLGKSLSLAFFGNHIHLAREILSLDQIPIDPSFAFDSVMNLKHMYSSEKNINLFESELFETVLQRMKERERGKRHPFNPKAFAESGPDSYLLKQPQEPIDHINYAMQIAVGTGSINAVNLLIKYFPELQNCALLSDGRTALYFAISEHQDTMVIHLHQLGTPLIVNTLTLMPPLFLALGNVQMLRVLVSLGSNPLETWPDSSGSDFFGKPITPGSSLLHAAAIHNALSALYFLIKEANVPINTSDASGNTALHICAASKIEPNKNIPTSKWIPRLQLLDNLCLLAPPFASFTRQGLITTLEAVQDSLWTHFLELGYTVVTHDSIQYLELPDGQHQHPASLNVVFNKIFGRLNKDFFFAWLRPDMVIPFYRKTGKDMYSMNFVSSQVSVRLLVALGANVGVLNGEEKWAI
ncbi:hypothetical protein HK100_004688 [Physocladia obscura]|uniref:F-box domain-containing protein n=1 Tax=Physocladia obscura TaxID=109957 RepID=A0AAD5SSL1_9FUNG|nr:hypothetical protein HK100_004688 [Physocladia obscura]